MQKVKILKFEGIWDKLQANVGKIFYLQETVGKIFAKVEDSSKITQDQKTFVSALVYLFTSIATNSFL